jgi:hypothetical protein
MREKKIIIFCDGEVFPLDRDLLMGTSIPIRKQSILIAYIVKSIKNQKGKPCEMDLPFLKNDITNNLGPQKPVIYSRYRHNYSFVILYYGITKNTDH